MKQVRDQVCTLDQSKRLKELGVNKPSLFWFTQHKTPTNPNLHYYGYAQKDMPWEIFFNRRGTYSGSTVFEEFPAYTVSELAEMLPQRFNAEGFGNAVLLIDKLETTWGVHYVDIKTETAPYIKEVDKTLAQPMARILIRLLENKIITSASINK